MGKTLFAVCVLGTLTLTCCGGFVDYGTRVDPTTGKSAFWSAGEEMMTNGLSGFEKGGIVAGVLGLIFTVTKTGLRLWSGYQASKAPAMKKE